ncbi:hypothetical protein [Paractinoplanes brasiliensis]|uniref:hypothetical protein n=1 Tax=Paractinoplanes brasiliensis TaxID=52695 RepID=UPI001414F839|nr:hypothetical protein [Actinoplanes brasiliensis]
MRIVPRVRFGKRWVRRLVTAGALVVAVGVLTSAGGELWVRGTAHGHVFGEGRSS